MFNMSLKSCSYKTTKMLAYYVSSARSLRIFKKNPTGLRESVATDLLTLDLASEICGGRLASNCGSPNEEPAIT